VYKENKIVIGPKTKDIALYIEHTIKDNQIILAKDGVEETNLVEATNLWDMEHANAVLKTLQNNRDKFYEPGWVDTLYIFEVEIEARKKEIV
jgi:hypothetical protein